MGEIKTARDCYAAIALHLEAAAVLWYGWARLRSLSMILTGRENGPEPEVALLQLRQKTLMSAAFVEPFCYLNLRQVDPTLIEDSVDSRSRDRCTLSSAQPGSLRPRRRTELRGSMT